MRLEFRGPLFATLLFSTLAIVATAAAQSVPPPAAPTAPQSYPSRVLRQTTFNIPFTVETARQPLEVQLHLSRDRGQSWKLYTRQNPSAKFFPFRATQDGEYWFASQTIDASRTPAEMAGRQPELHVIVDTAEPQFDLQAVAGPSREIQITWRGNDPTLDPSSLKIEYQAGREQPWQPISIPAAAAGTTISGSQRFVPRVAWVELQIRAEVSDLARNKTVVTRRLTASPTGRPLGAGATGWRPVATRSTRDPDRPVPLPPTGGPSSDTVAANPQAPNLPRPTNDARRHYPVGYGSLPIGLAPAKPANTAADTGVPVDPYANARPTDDLLSQAQTTPAPAPPSFATSTASPPRSTEWKSTQRAATGADRFDGTVQHDSQAADPLNELAGQGPYQPQPGSVQPLVSQQMATSQSDLQQRDSQADPQQADPQSPNDDRPAVDATAPSGLSAESNRVPLPLRMTSAMRFELDYEFDAAAANGARSVELWGTRDLGKTWSRWQVDEDRQSPLDVNIDAEGTFGFRIVIVGNNGLAGDAPRNGDDADLWVGVDTTAPVVQIHTATYGEGEHAGKLDIRWEATDASFGEDPISILFSDQATGPWTTIAANVPNTGQYFWPIDPRVPEKLFLRIEARDRAGNVGEYRLPDSVNLSGFTPRARIRGIRPVNRASQAGAGEADTSDLESAPQATRNPYFYR